MPEELENREVLPARSRSVRRRLFRDLAILLLVIAGAMLAVAIVLGGRVKTGFANEDKCRLHFKNLIAQHIGIEHSGSLNFEIHPVKGRQLIFIECERSEKPVFLSHRNEEGFYIRSGPSSVKLPVSKVLQYLESRK